MGPAPLRCAREVRRVPSHRDLLARSSHGDPSGPKRPAGQNRKPALTCDFLGGGRDRRRSGDLRLFRRLQGVQAVRLGVVLSTKAQVKRTARHGAIGGDRHRLRDPRGIVAGSSGQLPHHVATAGRDETPAGRLTASPDTRPGWGRCREQAAAPRLRTGRWLGAKEWDSVPALVRGGRGSDAGSNRREG